MDSLTPLLNSAPWVRRLAAAALALMIGAAVAGTVVLGIGSLHARADKTAEMRERLGRLQSVAAMKPMFEKLEARSGSMNGGRPEFLHGASDAVIQANLQTRLNDIAARHGVEIASVGNAPLREEGGMRLAGLRANITGTNEGIQQTIYAIETSKPYLMVREAQLHSTAGAQQDPEAGPVEVVLQVQFYGVLPPGSATADETTGAVR